MLYNKLTKAKFFVFLLILALILPISVNAVESRESAYLAAYSAYVYPAGWGKVQVWATVEGTNVMEEIGTISVRLYESKDNETWELVETYHYSDYPDLFGYNNFYHIGHVEYNGTIGRYYKAYVCVWAGENGTGDSRYFWTSAKKATLFAA